MSEAKRHEIDKTIFNNEDKRTEDLHLQLSEKYMVYKDLADRVILNPTQQDKNDNRVFYIKPDNIFMAEPRIQNQFRSEFIKQVSTPPMPEPFTLMADDMQKRMLDDIRDQSHPHMVRDKMVKFYQRRQYKLQHKRHKILQRWSHFAVTSEVGDRASISFQPQFAKLQFDLEQAVKRHQRLDGDDHLNNEPRPMRIEPNGKINPEDYDVEKLHKHSTLRVDDIDVYNRIIGYEERCQSASVKFVNRAKWVAMSHRFDIYIQAQERIQTLRESAIECQKQHQKRMEAKAKYLIELRKLGERGMKELEQIKDTFTFVKQEKKVRSVRDTYYQTASYNHELPPMILWNQLDLKLLLEDLCNEFEIKGDMEIDDGNSFSYQVVTRFPSLFFGQMIKTQFAPYDAVPQILNPREIGRTDIQEIMEKNIKKYGKGPPGSTLLEQLEIQKQSEQMKIQYINQIEKALFGEFNNGQLDDFPKVRLHKSHWIPYVCFKAELSKQQMLQAALLRGEQNPIDQVVAHMLEILNINDITNVNLTLESLAQIHYDKLKSGRVRADFFNVDHSDTDTIFNEDQKAFLQLFMNCIKTKSDYGYKPSSLQDETEMPKNSLYDAQYELLFAQYLMVCLKAREHKTKLLYTLNAFRSVQKRIALELRELGTRDRVNFDVNIVEPKEKQGEGLSSNAQEDTILKKTDLHVESIINDEMVDINRYKFDQKLQNSMWSTNPILPKFHITFGEPLERQEVSYEFEFNKDKDPRNAEATRLLGRIDFLRIHKSTGTILVQDDYGINLMYDCTFADMRALEQEMVTIMSYYINKIEPMQDTDLRSVLPAVDRFNMVKEIIMCEEKYQQAKLDLVFCYLECYEHSCDIVDQQRIIQIIVDLMAKRPRMNLAANHFKDSYSTECKVFETQTKLLREFINLQLDNELKANSQIREALEKTYRLIYDQLENKWQYYDQVEIEDEVQRRRLKVHGIRNQKDTEIAKKLENARPGIFLAKQPNNTVQIFADMLGLPINNLHMLLKEHHERDPLVKQSLNETVSFIKLQEGYPAFFNKTEVSHKHAVHLTPRSDKVGILEIFESLSQVTKVAAVINNAFTEIENVHNPDNGLVAATYDLVTAEFLLAEFRAVKAECRGDRIVSSRDQDLIEDTSLLGNSEQMLFLTKEVCASFEDSAIVQNPTFFTKLDEKTLQDFNFDLVQDDYRKKEEAQAKQRQNMTESTLQREKSQKEQQTKKVKDEKVLDTVEALEKMFSNPDDSFSEDEDDQKDQKLRQKLATIGRDMRFTKIKAQLVKPTIPSMMLLCCNQVEIQRLRYILVEIYHQRQALISLYNAQCKRVGKEPKVYFSGAFNFDTHISGGENWKNFVDSGPNLSDNEQTRIKSELSITEFDRSLTSCLNFSDPEAFKMLMQPLGLEELRIAVRYELMNYNTLVLAVRHNQILIDNCQRQLAEIELFEKGYLVSAPASDIRFKLVGSNLFEQNLKRLPDNEKRRQTVKLSEKISKCAYSIIARKNRPKEYVEKAYKSIRQAIIDKKFPKCEQGLRYLRTSRILLCHDYCTDIESSLFLDAIRMELIHETNQIRRRSYLLPRESMVHTLPPAEYGEHQYASYKEEVNNANSDDQIYTYFWDTDKKQISDFWRLPNNYECCTLDLRLEEFQKLNQKRQLYAYDLTVNGNESVEGLPSLTQADQVGLIKNVLPQLCQLSLDQAESTVQSHARFVDYEQAPSLENSLVTQYLFYFRQMQNLFDLEFFRNKMATKAHSIATLEQSVMSGLPFWEDAPNETQESDDSDDEEPKKVKKPLDPPYSLQDNTVFKNRLAELCVQKIQEEKAFKIQLNTDLDSFKEPFDYWAARMTKQQVQGDLQQSGIYLHELVQQSFYNILLILYLVRENQARAGEHHKELQAVSDLLKLFSHTDDTKVTYTNGYHVNAATTCTARIGLDETCHRVDYNNFFMATQPIIDEQGLNPPEFTLVQGIYTANAHQIKQYRRMRPYAGWLANRDFHYLDFKLLNLSRDLRKFIGARVKEAGQSSLQFAHQKFRLDASNYQTNFGTQLEVFNEQKQFTRMQIRAKKLQAALIILMTKRLLPSDAAEFQQAMKSFNDLFSWKVIDKIDAINKHRQNIAIQALERAQADGGVKKIQEHIHLEEPLTNTEMALYDQASCEVDIYQREIQNFMILTAKRLIERETTSLAKAFELNGKRLEVLIDVHQQFAATFDSTDDKRNHLDIVNKVAPVQKMLTQIKNRMLVIKTLTGGEGIIIRTKDLNSILEDLCRSILKNGEIEMRTRCEQLSMQVLQYENLLYAKDQQLFNMEYKLRHAKDELNKIVNTKVFSKGNSLIYELDHTTRQLRLIKDNISTLEQKLKDKIRLSFDKDLEQARLALSEIRKKFSEYQRTLNSHVVADVTREINELHQELPGLKLNKTEPGIQKTGAQLVDEYAHLLQGDAKKDYKEAQITGLINSRLYNSKDLEGVFREFERLKQSEKEAREQRLQMENLIRKQRMLQNFKWLTAQQRQAEKVDNLKEQLTSNSTLWEQLAEGEKREKVLKQELQRTQEEVASQNKVLEQLRDELKYEQLEKHKLLNFKETKMKRLNQLEDMSKQMELMQSIDLDKVLGSMGQKEKQLEQLKTETKDGAEVIAQIYRSRQKEIARSREMALQESKIKDAAMSKMDQLRAEIQLLQSGDLTSMNLWKDKVQKLKDQKSEFLNDNRYMNQTSGSLGQPSTHKDPSALHDHSPSVSLKRSIQGGTKVLPSLSAKGSSTLKTKRKHTNIFEQLVQDSQLINHSSYKEPLSTRKYAQKLLEDSLLQPSIQSSLTPHHAAQSQNHRIKSDSYEIDPSMVTPQHLAIQAPLQQQRRLVQLDSNTAQMPATTPEQQNYKSGGTNKTHQKIGGTQGKD